MSAAAYRAKYGLPERLEKGEGPGHPFRGNQYVRGRGAIAATGARELPGGGFTINPRSPSKVLRMGDDEVYIVATHPQANRQIPGTQLRTQAQRREAIRQYIKDHQDIIDANPDVMVGGWLHTAENGVQTVHLDLVSAFADKQQALSIGRKYNEIAIFDLKAGEDITVTKRYSDPHDSHRASEPGRTVADRAVGRRRGDRGLLRESGVATSRSGVTKGEGSGHPFRGNQWTGGKGGGAVAAEARRGLPHQTAVQERLNLFRSADYQNDALATEIKFKAVRAGEAPDDPLTVASAARIQKTLGPDALVDIAGMHGVYAHELANSIDRTVTRYPEAGNHLRVVRIDANRQLPSGTDGMTVLHADQKNRASVLELVVGDVYGRRPIGTAEANGKIAVKSGWHPAGDARHIFDHELGHVVDYTAARKAGVLDSIIRGKPSLGLMVNWGAKKYLVPSQTQRAKLNEFHNKATANQYAYHSGQEIKRSLHGWEYGSRFMGQGGGFTEYLAEAFASRSSGKPVPRPLGSLLDGIDRVLDTQGKLFKRRVRKSAYDWIDSPDTISIPLCAGQQSLETIIKGFKSKAQWRWAFATGQPWARRWAHETPGNPVGRYRRLPRTVRTSRSKANLARRKVKKDAPAITTAPMVVEQVFDVGIAKGEGPGHPFRGNQHTGGKGGIGGTGAAVDAWIMGGASGDVKDAATHGIGRGMSEAQWVASQGNRPAARIAYQHAATLVGAVPNAPKEGEMYRGIAVQSGRGAQAFPLQVGGRYSEPLASWSTDKGLAERFSSGDMASAHSRPTALVTIRVANAPGIRATAVDPAERISGGNYVVRKVTQVGTGDVNSGYHPDTSLPPNSGSTRIALDSYGTPRAYFTGIPKYEVEVVRVGDFTMPVQKGEGPGHPFRGNQWTGGKGGVGRIAGLMDAVAAGRPVTVDPKELSPLMLAMYARTDAAKTAGRTPPHFDLKHVSIAGVSKDDQPWSNPKNNLGLKRSEMPQVPRAKGIKDNFIAGLRARGLVKDETVNPLTLRSIQKEINGANTGRVIHAMRGGALSGDRIPVSREGFILDGHHRVAAYVAEGKPIPVFRVDLSVYDLIREANLMNQREGVQVRGIHELGPTVMKAIARAEARKAK